MKKSLFLTLMLSLALSHPLVAEEVTVGTGYLSDVFPFSTNSKYSTTETIYTASELGGSGTITSISYNSLSSGVALDSEVKIYMGHKAEDGFSSVSDNMPASALTLVYDHSVTLGNSREWIKFDLDNQFEYKGDQNLVVVVCKSATNTAWQSYYSTTGVTKRTINRYSNDSSLYAEVEETEGFSEYTTRFPSTKFEFLSETVEKDGATYLLRTNSGSAFLMDGQNCSGDLIIPDALADAKGISYHVTAIQEEAFEYNKNITSVSIPKHVTSIGANAFGYCDKLTKVYIEDMKSWCGIKFSHGAQNPLYWKNAALYLNNELVVHLEIPEGVTELSDYHFTCCSSIKKVSLPSTIEKLGTYTFDECYLTDVFCYAKEVPDAYYDSHGGTLTHMSNGRKVYPNNLYIHNGYHDVYANNTAWEHFDCIYEMDDQCDTPELSFDGKKIVISSSTKNAKINFDVTFDCDKKESVEESSVSFEASIIFSAYATAEGYSRSDRMVKAISLSSGMTGDLNEDGKVNIGDVTTLVNKILQKDVSE